MAPPSWRGGLPITYRIGGPGPAKVHLKVSSNWDQKPVYNVIARIPGSTYPDEWVLRGNHHDAWVNGAEDPIAGLIALLEEARSYGELFKQGWKPKRTIVYCAWDGEEPGLLGSTEWVEAHADELLQHAVAYFNSDTNGRGYLRAEGSHILEKFINGVARDITDPEKGISVWKRKQLLNISRAHNPEERQEVRLRNDLRIGAMGDGSDYTAFIHHLGIPSADIRYGGEMDGGIYHSIYDDFYWYTHYGDPNFAYGRALSQTMGTAVMRLADADILPFDFTNFSETVRRYLSDVQKLLSTQQSAIRERNKEIEEGVFAAVSDPNDPVAAPPVAETPAHFNFAPLQNAIDKLERSAERYNAAWKRAQAGGLEFDRQSISRINKLLMQAGPKLTDPAGLPGRPWFKNQIYAPGAYTGYESKPLPGILEAMDRRDWKEAESQIPRAAQALERETALIDQLTTALQEAHGKLGYRYFLDGNPDDVKATTRPGIALMGGGTDQDAAFAWMCERAGTGDFVVIRSSGSDGYNPYIRKLCPSIDSVETLVITSREGAMQPFVAEKIRNAEALFIAGGDQANYINFWQNGPVQAAIDDLIAKGVPVGGTSAGLAVLAEYNFSALKDTVQSKEALPDPFDPRVTIGRGFLKAPYLEGKITDSHFSARDRMGRLVVFLARMATDGGAAAPYGIGIDEKTAVLLDGDGSATVVGKGAAYFLHATGAPEQCAKGTPVTYRNVSVYRLKQGEGKWNFKTWSGAGGSSYILSAENGVLKSTQSGNLVY